MKTLCTLAAFALALAAQGQNAPSPASRAAKPVPKILISTNVMTAAEAAQASRLKADGTWFIGYNSPDIGVDLWRSACRQIGTSIFVTEDGGISPGYLMNAQLTPRLALRGSTGDFVTAVANGGPLSATVPTASRSDWQIYRWSFAPSKGTTPVKPTLFDLPKGGQKVMLQAFGDGWVTAPGGGGGFLDSSTPKTEPGYWNFLGLNKRTTGDSTLRTGDRFGIQTWQGFFSGGNWVSADLNQGARLLANRPSVGAWETFSLLFPCEFVTGGQIAPVTHAMAYHEFSDVAPGAREYTLNVSNIDEVARRVGGPKVVVLGRSFVDLSEAPDILPTLRQQVLNALGDGNCKGVVWEISAGGDLSDLIEGIDTVRARGKDCFVMIAPRRSSTNYSSDLKRTLAQLKGAKFYGSLNLVLTSYRTADTEVPFLGGSNSVEGALKWLKSNR